MGAGLAKVERRARHPGDAFGISVASTGQERLAASVEAMIDRVAAAGEVEVAVVRSG